MSTFGAHPSCHPGDLVAELTSGRFPMFSTLVELVEYAGLVETLSDTDDITVLCPTNDAFLRAGIEAPAEPGAPATMHGEAFDSKEVAHFLSCHVLKGRKSQLRKHRKAHTLANTEVEIFTDKDMRTMVQHGQNSACVLMQGFTSSNAAFAGIGRVLFWGDEDLGPASIGAQRHLSASFVAHEGHPHM